MHTSSFVFTLHISTREALPPSNTMNGIEMHIGSGYPTSRIGSGGMMVDWPRRDDGATRTTIRRAVSFSPTSEMYIVPQESSSKSMFYSREEIDTFKRNLQHDIHQMRRHFASGEETSREVLYDCMGLENFASQDVLRRIVTKRRAHVNAVLQEQQRGTNSSINSIAMVSMIYSRWARQRAEKIALSYVRLGEVV